MTVIAGLAAALAVLVVRPEPAWVLRHRLGLRSAGPRVLPVVVVPVVLLVVVLAPDVAPSPAHVVVALTVLGVAAFAIRTASAQRRRAAAQRRREQVADAVAVLAAELRAGLAPASVLQGLAADVEVLAPAARVAALAGDVPTALREAARSPGCSDLRTLAGAWLVAERAGAPLADVLDRLDDAAREDREIEREVQAGVAPARATGRLMAVLPVLGLLLGSGMGADPVGVLLHTVPGSLCLAAGCLLACLGVAWVERLAASVEAT